MFGLPDEELAKHGAKRYVVDTKPGYPDRIEVRDAELGEAVILLNYIHQPADNAYHASHAIFVREGAETAYDRTNEIPDAMRLRQMSLRAFDADHLMVDADLATGHEIADVIERLFADPRGSYIHAHYAKRGCYAARIDRALMRCESPTSPKATARSRPRQRGRAR